MYTELLRDGKMKSLIIVRNGFFKNIRPSIVLSKRNYSSTHFIVTDEIVNSIYGEKLEKFFGQSGFSIKKIVIPPGEKSKSFANYKNITETILASGIDKQSNIIGFGGGVINNLAGFIASTLYRGIRLIQIPTTLIAQLDAAIDFKQAINSTFGKNQLGSFYLASITVVDQSFLSTLPRRHIRNGLAESIKHALVHNEDLFRRLASYRGEITDHGFLKMIINRTISLKISILKDSKNPEFLEMLSQYGHPIGHALEYLSNYQLLHGESIAIGMCVMAEVAYVLGISDLATKEKHYEIIRHFNLPTTIPTRITNGEIIELIKRDKHFVGNMHSVLLRNIGKVAENRKRCIFEIPTNILKRALTLNRKQS